MSLYLQYILTTFNLHIRHMLSITFHFPEIEDFFCRLTHTYAFKHAQGSRGGRAVTRLASQAEDPGSMPGAGSHIIHLFVVYVNRIHNRPTDGDVKWRSRVSVEFHVSVSEFCILLFPLYVR